MRKILLPLLALVLLCVCTAVPALGDEAVTLEVNTGKLPVHAAGDPYLAELGAVLPEGETLPVLVLPVKKSQQLKVTVKPRTVKDKKFTLSADDETVVQIRGNTVSGARPGTAVLTVASHKDPSAAVQYRVLVIQPVTRIAITAPDKSVAVGKTITLAASILPEDAAMKGVTWESANEQIATVDANGTVTGLKRGKARINAVAADGSNIRANINIQVTQDAQEITLDKQDVNVDVGRNTVLKATVLPKDTDDKKVVWSSTDESIATVNSQGRIAGVALGECEVICTSAANGEIQARATVHVKQPVTKVSFTGAPTIYAGESARLTVVIEPENASNKAVTFRSGNEKILTVSEDGTINAVKAGETYVNVVTQDGSNRQARIKIKVFQHVTGVHMRRRTAYIDINTSSKTSAVLEPSNATNQNMTWESADPYIATAEAVARQTNRVSIRGVSRGETIVTGITEDGGFPTSIVVKVGDWESSLKLTEAHVEGDAAILKVKNVSELNITSITAEISVFDIDGQPVPCCTKNDGNTFQMVYKKPLAPGATTKEGYWKVVNYKLPTSLTVSDYVVRITEFEIDNDWVKLIRKNRQPTKKCPVHL